MARQYFLDENGLKFFASQLVNKMDLKINSRMTFTIDDDSTADEIPSAKAVYELLIAELAKVSGLSFEVVDVLPPTGENGIIYLVPQDAADPNNNVHNHFIWIDDDWVELGSTDIDLTNYWSKEDLQPISNADILEILEEVFGPFAPAGP